MALREATVNITRWSGGQHPTLSNITSLMKKDGLRPYMWFNAPNHRYGVRSHGYGKVLYVVDGSVESADVKFENGRKSIRIELNNGTAGIHQGRVYIQDGFDYNGSVWLKPEQGSVQVTFRAKDSGGNLIAETPLKTSGSQWQEVGYSFSSPKTDTQASVELEFNL